MISPLSGYDQTNRLSWPSPAYQQTVRMNMFPGCKKVQKNEQLQQMAQPA
jgi:hypothetical protein